MANEHVKVLRRRETEGMKLSIWVVLGVFSPWRQGALAQQAAANTALNDEQLLGMRLFNQSCRSRPLRGRRQ
jgi:hypothetical protein